MKFYGTLFVHSRFRVNKIYNQTFVLNHFFFFQIKKSIKLTVQVN